ncbi:hypothetical protein B1H19_04735 [Streptomyces gilvosporeus]|uniref:Uncharacterized protein n=1 Tax=Streptomyces gilvosporeus TaxID=553510 RepID=A0A1V0TKW0_9ACTN|nr:hypothetical protein B1H19_04735 [Streptomyces gilvosporeus]
MTGRYRVRPPLSCRTGRTGRRPAREEHGTVLLMAIGLLPGRIGGRPVRYPVAWGHRRAAVIGKPVQHGG